MEELRKAIRSGDKERAEGLAVTLLRERRMNPKGVFKNPDPIDPSWIIMAIIALGAVALAFLDWWSRRPKKEVVKVV